MITAESIITIAAAVVALTQFAKWGGVSDKQGPLVVLALSAVGMAMWAASTNEPFNRAMIWPYFSGWITVSVSAAGVFGFTRATSEAVTKTKNPPPGAAQNATEKVFTDPNDPNGQV